MNITLETRKDDKQFGRGERAIMVDGVQWGRTHVSSHGCHGTKHVFEQTGGDIIGDMSKGGYFHEIAVRSEKRRPWMKEDSWKPTEDRVLDKARELVTAGRLRNPDVVRAERAALHAKMEKNRESAAEREATEFANKALAAIGLDLTTYIADAVNQTTVDELRKRIVAAMRWAQTQ